MEDLFLEMILNNALKKEQVKIEEEEKEFFERFEKFSLEKKVSFMLILKKVVDKAIGEKEEEETKVRNKTLISALKELIEELE